MESKTQMAVSVLKQKRAALLEQADALNAVIASLGGASTSAPPKKAAKKGKGGGMAAAHVALAKKRAEAKAAQQQGTEVASGTAAGAGASLSEAAAS